MGDSAFASYSSCSCFLLYGSHLSRVRSHSAYPFPASPTVSPAFHASSCPGRRLGGALGIARLQQLVVDADLPHLVLDHGVSVAVPGLEAPSRQDEPGGGGGEVPSVGSNFLELLVVQHEQCRRRPL